MNYKAKGRRLGYVYDGVIQVFNLFGSYGALSEDGTKSFVAFSHTTPEEVIAILKGNGFDLEESGEPSDGHGNLVVCINGQKQVLGTDGNFPTFGG